MKSIVKISFAALIAAAALTGCKKEYPDPAPYTPVDLSGEVTHTIKELKAMYLGEALTIDQDVVIEGTVVSSDRSGNISRSIYLDDGVTGIEVKIGQYGNYLYYPIGMTVFVKAKGLTLGAYGDMVSLGVKSYDTKYENSWPEVQEWIDETIFRGSISAQLPVPVEITTLAQLSDVDLRGRYVRFSNILFKKNDALNTWANTASAGNQYLRFDTSPTSSNDVVIRTSQYASFARRIVPFNSGDAVKVEGIFSVFGATNQLLLNSDTDIVKLGQ